MFQASPYLTHVFVFLSDNLVVSIQSYRTISRNALRHRYPNGNGDLSAVFKVSKKQRTLWRNATSTWVVIIMWVWSWFLSFDSVIWFDLYYDCSLASVGCVPDRVVGFIEPAPKISAMQPTNQLEYYRHRYTNRQHNNMQMCT